MAPRRAKPSLAAVALEPEKGWMVGVEILVVSRLRLRLRLQHTRTRETGTAGATEEAQSLAVGTRFASVINACMQFACHAPDYLSVIG